MRSDPAPGSSSPGARRAAQGRVAPTPGLAKRKGKQRKGATPKQQRAGGKGGKGGKGSGGKGSSSGGKGSGGKGA